MSYTTLTFDVKDHVATIMLNQSEAAKAMNLDLAKDLMHVALKCNWPSQIPSVSAS